MRIVKLLRKRHHQEKIFEPEKVAAEHYCLVRSEYFAELAEKAKKSLPRIIGFAQIAVINLRHDSEKGSSLDKINGMV